MALRAGYYGVKRNMIDFIKSLNGAKVIKTIGDGLKLTSAGALSVDINTETMEFLNGKLSAKSTGGGLTIIEKDWALFDGINYIKLPFTVNADYKISVAFDMLEDSLQAVYGNTVNDYVSHLTRYSNKWYCSDGDSPANFEGSGTGQHTFVENSGGKSYFDDNVVVAEFTPTTNNNAYICVGFRQDAGGNFKGKMKSFTIESISTQEKVVELIPALLIFGDPEGDFISIPCMYDTVNHKYYSNCIKEVGDYTS